MKYIFKSFALLVLIFWISGCEKTLVGTEPESSHVASFEEFWKEMDKNFCYFPDRKMDWDSVYRLYQPQLKPTMTDRELVNIFLKILSALNVGHLDIYTPLGVIEGLKSPAKNYLGGIPASRDSYLDILANNKVFLYGTIRNTNFGYIEIKSFMGGSAADYEKIDEILRIFKDKKGIVIDVRNNGGGDSSYARDLMSRFTKESTLVEGYARYRKSKNRTDFTDWETITFSKKGSETYLGNIVMLTSRNTASACETFVKTMQTLPQVTSVGDATWGSIGSRPVHKMLPNGWYYRMPVAYEVDKNKKSVEGVGFEPNFKVLNTETSIRENQDLALLKAIEILKSK